MALVLLDAYTTRREGNRTYMVRYGSVLVAPWEVACALSALLCAVQCGVLYYQSHPTACSVVTAPLSVIIQPPAPQLLTPQQIMRPVTSGTAYDELQEAFRLARAHCGVHKSQ